MVKVPGHGREPIPSATHLKEDRRSRRLMSAKPPIIPTSGTMIPPAADDSSIPALGRDKPQSVASDITKAVEP